MYKLSFFCRYILIYFNLLCIITVMYCVVLYYYYIKDFRAAISSAEARRTVCYADVRPQSFTLREEARSCSAALSRNALLQVIVERHLVLGYYALKRYSLHVTHPRRKALPYVRKRDAARTLREESPYFVFNGQLDYNLRTQGTDFYYFVYNYYCINSIITVFKMISYCCIHKSKL